MQELKIERAAVLGAGVMGAQIAAVLADEGITVTLLDVVPASLESGQSRSILAERAIARLRTLKPAAAKNAAAIDAIVPGNLEDDLGVVASADWVIEVVVENMSAKQSLWKRVGALARPGTILSSNTSGLSLAGQASALPAELRSTFLGTHFFNPPRHLKLLEVTPIAETDQSVLAAMSSFAEERLGKGVVLCRDTPNFIGNRIGIYDLSVGLAATAELGLPVDVADIVLGPLIGRSRSATFRTVDIIGLDTFAHVARTALETATDADEREAVRPAPFVEALIARGRLGNKTGEGFFKRMAGAAGESVILSLDLASFDYVPRSTEPVPSLKAAQGTTIERIRHLVASDDAAGRLAWRCISRTLAFSARVADEIAGRNLDAIDRAMRWGWSWEYGPFAVWNGLGVRAAAERMAADGISVPDWVGGVDRFKLADD